MASFQMEWGGSHDKYDVQEGGGGIGKADVCGQGEGGGPKSRKFCGRHLSMAPKGASIKYVRTKEKEVKS